MTIYLRSSRHSKEAGHVIFDGFTALSNKIKQFTPHVPAPPPCTPLPPNQALYTIRVPLTLHP